MLSAGVLKSDQMRPLCLALGINNALMLSLYFYSDSLRGKLKAHVRMLASGSCSPSLFVRGLGIRNLRILHYMWIRNPLDLLWACRWQIRVVTLPPSSSLTHGQVCMFCYCLPGGRVTTPKQNLANVPYYKLKKNKKLMPRFALVAVWNLLFLRIAV